MKFVNRGDDDYFGCDIHKIILKRWPLPKGTSTQAQHAFWDYALHALKAVLRERRNTISSAIKKYMISKYIDAR
jgi:hypothetical protein